MAVSDYTTTEPENRLILAERTKNMDKNAGPRTGDWLEFSDGHTCRIAYHWGDRVQPASGNGDTGSFYLSHGGYADYSGGLETGIPVECLTDTGRTHEARVWFFSRDYHTAHNGVTFTVPFRVYQVTR